MSISDWSSDVCSSDLFKKEELSYLEAGQHLRSLNQQLWQVPSMVIAITGGIWYGAASITGGSPKILALGFAVAVNILTIPDIGSASCRERVCLYVLIQVVAVSLKKKNNIINTC